MDEQKVVEVAKDVKEDFEKYVEKHDNFKKFLIGAGALLALALIAGLFK